MDTNEKMMFEKMANCITDVNGEIVCILNDINAPQAADNIATIERKLYAVSAKIANVCGSYEMFKNGFFDKM